MFCYIIYSLCKESSFFFAKFETATTTNCESQFRNSVNWNLQLTCKWLVKNCLTLLQFLLHLKLVMNSFWIKTTTLVLLWFVTSYVVRKHCNMLAVNFYDESRCFWPNWREKSLVITSHIYKNTPKLPPNLVYWSPIPPPLMLKIRRLKDHVCNTFYSDLISKLWNERERV